MLHPALHSAIVVLVDPVTFAVSRGSMGKRPAEVEVAWVRLSGRTFPPWVAHSISGATAHYRPSVGAFVTESWRGIEPDGYGNIDDENRRYESWSAR
jgi:hypothetical protein